MHFAEITASAYHARIFLDLWYVVVIITVFSFLTLRYHYIQQLEVSRNLKHRKSSSAAGKRNNVPAQASTFVVPVPVAVPPTSTVALPKKYMSNSRSAAARGGLEPAAKRQKLVQESDEPVYPFFGNELPSAPKSIALRCLEFLNGKDIYSTSLLNQLWCKAAMDNALWEADE